MRIHAPAGPLSHTPAFAVLAAAAAMLFFTAPTEGDFWWFDASRHAMNAVFVRDFFLDGGLAHPIEFARAYYRHTPGINIGFYPPLFYLSAAPFVAVFGASHAVCQAVVALYAFAAGGFAYLIASRTLDRVSAAALAACVMLLPAMALWSRQVQLDVPAVAWLLGCAYGLTRYREHGARGALVLCALCLGLAIETRVQAVFALPAVAWALWPLSRGRLAALVCAGMIGLPALWMTAALGPANQALVAAMPGMPSFASVANWTWYLKQLPAQMGWPVMALLAAGLWASRGVGGRGHAPLLLAFAVCAWVFFTVVSNKDARFNLPALPFLLLAAGLAAAAVWPAVMRVVLVCLALWLGASAVRMQVPVVAGFGEAAKLASHITDHGANLLVSAHRDGSLIFNLRAAENRPDIGILRADKVLADIRIAAVLGVRDAGLSQADILTLLQRENVSTLVVQTGYLAAQPSVRNFYALLSRGDVFKPVARIKMRGATLPDERELVIYSRIKGG